MGGGWWAVGGGLWVEGERLCTVPYLTPPAPRYLALLEFAASHILCLATSQSMTGSLACLLLKKR